MANKDTDLNLKNLLEMNLEINKKLSEIIAVQEKLARELEFFSQSNTAESLGLSAISWHAYAEVLGGSDNLREKLIKRGPSKYLNELDSDTQKHSNKPISRAEAIRLFAMNKILSCHAPMKIKEIYKLAKSEKIEIPGSGTIENIIISIVRDPQNRFVKQKKGVYGIYKLHSGTRVGVDFQTKKNTRSD